MTLLRALIGIAFFCAVAWSLSSSRRRVPWRVVLWGLAAQAAYPVPLLRAADLLRMLRWFPTLRQLPLALRPGMPIGALSFEPLSGPAARPYNRREDAKYRDQQGAVASRIDKD